MKYLLSYLTKYFNLLLAEFGPLNRVFTDEQIDHLRASYANVRFLDPSGISYRRLIMVLDRLPPSALVQLRDAQIPFLSILASNRVPMERKQ